MRDAARARERADSDARSCGVGSLGASPRRERARASRHASRAHFLPCADGIDHLLQLRLNLPGLHETLAVLPEPLVTSSLPARALSPGARTWSGERGRAGVGSEGARREDVLGIRRERRARATRRCDRGRAGGDRGVPSDDARAEKRAISTRRRPTGSGAYLESMPWSSPQKSIRSRSLLQGLLAGTGDDRRGRRTDAAGRPRHLTWRRGLRDDAHVGRTRGVRPCVVGTELSRGKEGPKPRGEDTGYERARLATAGMRTTRKMSARPPGRDMEIT